MIVKRNANTAEIVGLSFGDGGLTYRNNSKRVKFQLRGDMREEKENYDKHITPLFNKEVMLPLFGRKVGIVFNKRMNFYGISVESVNIEKPLNYLGIPSGVKTELFVPKWIKKSKLYSKRFLRGYFDTDGSISCQRNYSIKNNQYHTQIRISLVSTSRNLIYEISEILLNLGFKIVSDSRKPKSKDGFERQIAYRIKICGGIQVDKWFEEIGSNSQKHITKYLLWKRIGFCPPNTTLVERKKMLKNELSPYIYYPLAGMPERSNGAR